MPPLLNRKLLQRLNFQHDTVDFPEPALLDLPEKVLQFGTGRLLRGFVDCFVDQANRKGLFDGRVVMVSSTGSGRGGILEDQDGLYTLVIRGLDDGEPTDTRLLSSSISRALKARDEWSAVLNVARHADLVAVVSNTTEVGLQLDDEDALDGEPPASFPAKLTACLHERARAFDFDPEAGLLVLPCELIVGNGDLLRNLVLQLAERWELEPQFTEWVQTANVFCNTLVDRIVTGMPGEDELERLWSEIGYEDRLLTVAEVYRLWAIEGREDLVRRFPVLNADPGIVVTDDITPYRERKVKILNGTHTIMVPAALLAGRETVRGALEHPLTGWFIREVMMEEIVPSLDVPQTEAFAGEVLDRFGNPYIEHRLINITLQSTMKMRYRIVPTIRAYVERTGALPQRMLFGFACYLFLMGDADYDIDDDRAAYFTDLWQGVDRDDKTAVRDLVRQVGSNTELWDTDLTQIDGFVDTVSGYVSAVHNDGASTVMQRVVSDPES